MKGTCVTNAVPLHPRPISTKGTRASCAVPIGHGPSSAKGTRAHSAVPLSRGINSATRVRVSNTAPLNHGKGAGASRATPPSHASRSSEAAVTARRPPKRTCSPSPLSDQVVAVGLRCGKANSKTLLPGHEMAVGLRCGKANTKHLDLWRGSIRCSLATVTSVLSFFPSRRSRRDWLPRPPSPRALTVGSLLGWDLCCHRGIYVATHPSPAHEDAYRVCRPCSVFTHANPRASGNVATGGARRRTDTARRASGDATASNPISWTLFP